MKKDRHEFILFCQQATDKQLVEIYIKETDAGRTRFAKIAGDELARRERIKMGFDHAH